MLYNVTTWKCVLQIQVWSGLCQLSRKTQRIDKVYHALAKSRLSEKAEEANQVLLRRGLLRAFSRAGHFTFAWQDFPDRHWQSGSGTQKNSVHRKVTSNLCMNQFDLFRMKQYYLEACFRPGELARNKPLSRWQFSFEWEWQLQNVMWGFERKERKREGKQLKNTNRLIILCFN